MTFTSSTDPTSVWRSRLMVIGIMLILGGAGLLIWLVSGDERAPLEAEPAGRGATAASDAAAERGLSFDALEIERTPRPPSRKITSQEVRRLQRRYASQIKYCYQKPSRRAGQLIQRKTQVAVHLAALGRVIRVDVDAGGDRELQRCLRRFIKQWRFPRGLGEQIVRFPIVFAR